MEKQILEVVLNMQANQLEMQKDIKDLKDGQKRLEEKYTGLQVDVNDLKDGQKRLEEKYTRLQVDVNDLKDGQKRLEEKYTGLQADVNDLKDGQKRLELLRRQDSINIARILEVQVEQLRDIG